MKRSTVLKLAGLAHWYFGWGYVLGGFVVISLPILVIIGTLVGYSRGGYQSSLHVRVRMDYWFQKAQATMGEGEALFNPGSATLTTLDGSFVGMLFSYLPPIIFSGLMLVAYKQFVGFTKTLAEFRPFDAGNAERLRKAGIVFAIGFGVDSIFGFARQSYARSIFEITQGEITFFPALNIYLLVTALLLLIFSAVFKIGADLQSGDEETV